MLLSWQTLLRGFNCEKSIRHGAAAAAAAIVGNTISFVSFNFENNNTKYFDQTEKIRAGVCMSAMKRMPYLSDRSALL